MTDVIWSDNNWSVRCPDCGESWADLGDYSWGHREEIQIECPHCGVDLVLHRRVYVDFGISRPRTTP
jgi:hypothetical protein